MVLLLLGRNQTLIEHAKRVINNISNNRFQVLLWSRQPEKKNCLIILLLGMSSG